MLYGLPKPDKLHTSTDEHLAAADQCIAEPKGVNSPSDEDHREKQT